MDWVFIAIEAKKKQKIIRDNKEVVSLCNQIYGASGTILNFDDVAQYFITHEGNIVTDDLIRKFWYSISADDIFNTFEKQYKAQRPEEQVTKQAEGQYPNEPQINTEEATEERPQKIVPQLEEQTISETESEN